MSNLRRSDQDNPAPLSAAMVNTERNQSSIPVKRPRVTPRNSTTNEETETEPQETPYDTLRRLANLIPRPNTPPRRASSAGPTINRSARRTPGAKDRTPVGVYRPESVRRANVLTPHARAAIRDLELRRAAALTPGRDRRRSERQQRETPRDALRQLSKILARDTKPTSQSPVTNEFAGRNVTLTSRNIDFDEGPDLVRPNLSIPLDEDDEEDSVLSPPSRSQKLADDDENHTQRSLEMPRRAVSEQARDRLSFGSFGSFIANDINQLGLDAPQSEISEPSFLPANFEDLDDSNLLDDTSAISEPTQTVRARLMDIDFDPLTEGPIRTSDIRTEQLIHDDTENTFTLAFPPPESDAEQHGFAAQSEGNIEAGDVDIDEEDQEGDESEIIRRRFTNEGAVTTAANISRAAKDVSPKKQISQGARRVKASRHGIKYSSLPSGVIKKLATTFLRTGGSGTKISRDALEAIMQASDWFFEQIGDDLGTYASHAGRKTIDESDVITLMKRQRQTSAASTPFALAQKYLPRELLQDVRMAPTSKPRKRTVHEVGGGAYEE